MKRVSLILFAALLVIAAAGRAVAGYEAGTLVQYIYEGTTDTGYELNTGLGSVETGELTERTVIESQPSSDLSEFDTSDWDELYVGFSAFYSEIVVGDLPFKRDTTSNVFMATTTPDVPDVNVGLFTTFATKASGVTATVSTGLVEKSNLVSYWEMIEAYQDSNVQGAYSGFNYDDRFSGYASLGLLDDDFTETDTGEAVIGRYVDLYLWQFVEYDPYEGDTETGFVDYEGNWADTNIATLRVGIQDDGEGNAQLYTQIIPGAYEPEPEPEPEGGSPLMAIMSLLLE